MLFNNFEWYVIRKQASYLKIKLGEDLAMRTCFDRFARGEYKDKIENEKRLYNDFVKRSYVKKIEQFMKDIDKDNNI